jgi:hypothetical protein
LDGLFSCPICSFPAMILESGECTSIIPGFKKNGWARQGCVPEMG